VIAVGELRDQIAKHVRRGWEAVQQQDDQRVGRARLTIKDLEAVDRLGPVICDDWCFVA